MATDTLDLIQDGRQPLNCRKHFRKIFSTHPFLYGFMFIGILTLDLTEITTDWLLLKDVLYIEQGLVYGPLRPVLVMVLLFASAGGSIAITFEVFNIFRDLCTGRPWINLDLDSCLVVWCEEIPTMAANFAIIMCHNEPISFYQLVKAIVVVLSVLLRIIIPLMRTYLITKQGKTEPNKTKFRKATYKVATNLGLCLTLSSAISFFIFTHVIAVDERKFQFRLPHDLWSGDYAHHQYFNDVGIYFHHKSFRQAPNTETWLKLLDIDDLYLDQVLYVKVSYIITSGSIGRLLINMYNHSVEKFRFCYMLETFDNGRNNYIPTTCSSIFVPQSSEKLLFKFLFMPPQSTLILGDIKYNVKHIKDLTCYNLTANGTNILKKQAELVTPEVFGRLLYMKQTSSTSLSQRLVQQNISSNQLTGLIQPETDIQLVGADDIWKTGMYGCDCTGSKGPTFDASLTLTC